MLDAKVVSRQKEHEELVFFYGLESLRYFLVVRALWMLWKVTDLVIGIYLEVIYLDLG